MTLSELFSGVRMLLIKYKSSFISGIMMTIKLSCITVLFGFIFGTIIAFMKMSSFKIWKIKPLNLIASIYIEIIRGTPLLLQLNFFYFFLPMAIPSMNFDKTTSVIIALTINSAGYVAEIIRSGIMAVDNGQSEAARCLGLSKLQTMRKIIIPQAIKNILPALGNELVTMTKETSLAATLFVGEIMTQCNMVGGATMMQIQTLIISGILYFILTFSLSKLVSLYERKLSVSD